MSDKSKIEWTDATWNPVTGCSVVSKGCTNCYAMRLAGTRLKHHRSRKGLTDIAKTGPVWNGQVRFNEWLTQPFKWKKPRRIFVCAHGDLFHENVKDEWIDKIFAVMALCQKHTFQVLTKRPKRMQEYLDGFAAWVRVERILNESKPNTRWNGNVLTAKNILDSALPLPNVWLGVSVEDQATAEERIPDLFDCPAALRWVSVEPLLGPLNLREWLPDRELDERGGLDWVVVGGESGPNARPMNPDWARLIRDQCRAARVPFFFKQMSKKATIPADLIIREYPEENSA